MFEIPENPKTDAEWPVRVIYEWEGAEHEGLAAADIDLDGVADLVGGGRWFEHTGGGSFKPHIIDDGSRFSRAAVGQIVEGGRPEVVFAPGDINGSIRWYEWKDGGWIGHDLPIPDLIHGHSIGVGDVNGDGHADIFSAEMGQWGKQADGNNPIARLRVFYGKGTGKFTEQVIASGFGNHESRIADLDGDGDLDILGKPYNWKTPRIDVWINESPAKEKLPLDRWVRHVIDEEKPWRQGIGREPPTAGVLT
ncbi:MAG: VCBS repeat-containing protein [Acidobacteria bacterium]|nr:VCBS repeat-containing protein [Acidobacteriota bacterium]